MFSKTLDGIIALVGAGAWLPYLRRFLPPNPTIAFAPSIEIGFTEAGPIVNIPISIYVSRRDIFINNCLLTIKHEDGDTHEMRWSWLHQVKGVLQIPIPGSPTLNITSHDIAIAISVSTKEPTEKNIGFQDIIYKNEYRKKFNELNKSLEYLRNQPDGIQNFLKSSELADAKEWYKNKMFWREGTYKFTLRLSIHDSSKNHEKSFTTTLNRNDINRFNNNIHMIDLFINKCIDPSNQLPIPWNWCNLDIEPLP